ncbi:MAG: GLPGLI family protein [Bacteroidetes bacterium]|nr:GLPGLI family protein [Bacteroidota bacterium]
MKKIVFTVTMGLFVLAAAAQQKQGRVVYERTVQMQMRIDGMGDAGHMIPRTRKDRLEVVFGNDRSLKRTLEDETPEEPAEGGMQIRMVVAGANDVTFMNFATGQVLEQKEFGGKNYLVSDSLRKMNWKLTGETTTILNYPCQKAVAQRIGKRTMSNMQNGQLKSEQIADTSNITAWFTLAIPVPAGPEYQGQLPGLILGIDVNDGRTMYRALEVSDKTDVAAIKEPTKGKKMTAAEFTVERDKLVQEMQKNMGGRGQTVRFGN